MREVLAIRSQKKKCEPKWLDSSFRSGSPKGQYDLKRGAAFSAIRKVNATPVAPCLFLSPSIFPLLIAPAPTSCTAHLSGLARRPLETSVKLFPFRSALVSLSTCGRIQPRAAGTGWIWPTLQLDGGSRWPFGPDSPRAWCPADPAVPHMPALGGATRLRGRHSLQALGWDGESRPRAASREGSRLSARTGSRSKQAQSHHGGDVLRRCGPIPHMTLRTRIQGQTTCNE
jgi:hypothetical protein